MTEEQDNFSLDDWDNEDETSLDQYSPAPQANVNPLIVETETLRKQNERLADELDDIRKHINSGKETAWLSRILEKYAEVDPVFKAFALELMEAHGKTSNENINKISKYIDKIQKDITTIDSKYASMEQQILRVDSDVKTRTLIKASMERYFKRNTISENAVDRATEIFFKKRQKDPSFELHVRNISNDSKLSIGQKDKLLGTLIAKEYSDYIKNKSTTAKDDATPKERIASDPEVDKIAKKHEKNKANALDEPADKPAEPNFDREVTRSRIKSILS